MTQKTSNKTSRMTKKSFRKCFNDWYKKLSLSNKIAIWAIIISVAIGFIYLIIGPIITHFVEKALSPKGQTPIPVYIVSQESTLSASEPVIVSPTTTTITTPLPSATQEVYFFDDFSSKSKYLWIMPYSAGGVSVSAGIEQGVLKITISCPDEYASPYCTTNIQIPNVSSKNFNISFDAMYGQLTNGASAIIAIIFRSDSLNGDYYSAQYLFRSGQCSLDEYYENDTINIRTENIGPNYYPLLNTVYNYSLLVDKDRFTISIHDNEIISEVNGDINAISPISLYFYVSRGSTATINIDNLKITVP